MLNANDRAAGERESAVIAIVWNPNTGQLDLNAKNCNPAETLGVLQMALLEAYAAIKKPAPMPAIIPARAPIMPHLKG